MSWITIIWSMVMSACLTLAAIHLLVWCKNRTAWGNLLFSIAAAATAVLAFCELWMMLAETPEQFSTALRCLHVPAWVMIVALVGFVRLHLRAGRPWLAWTTCVLRTFSLLLNFLVGQNLNFRQITHLRHIPFFGQSVSVAEGVSNPWMLVGQLSLLFFVVFVTDAAITVWRRGDRRQAMMIGGSIVFFALAGTVQAVLVLWEIVDWPITASLFFVGFVVAMGYELGCEALRAVRLSHDLRESEARLSLAADSAGAGLWSWDFKSGLIWATEKAHILYGFPIDEEITADKWLFTIHPDDRDRVDQTAKQVIKEGADFRAEYRIVLPDRSIRWITARGQAYLKPSGEPDRMMGVSVDITERKRTEEKLLASQDELRAFTSRLLTIQEEERRRLARELHDDFTQRLAVIAIDISKLEVSSTSANTKFEPKLKQIRDQIIKLSTDIHDISRQLHPSIIDDLGLGRAIQSECKNFTRRAGIVIEYKQINIPPTIPRDISIGLFRITQEALRNIQKHAHVKDAQVCLIGGDDHITLKIHDSGTGFDPASVKQTHGLGLFSMKERVQLIRGVFSIDSAPGQGTQISVVVPLDGIKNG